MQVRVTYSKTEWDNTTGPPPVDSIAHEWVDLTRYDEKEKRVMEDTPLLVNIKVGEIGSH